MKLRKKLYELAQHSCQGPFAPSTTWLFSTPPRERRTIDFADVIGLPIFLKEGCMSFIATAMIKHPNTTETKPQTKSKEVKSLGNLGYFDLAKSLCKTQWKSWTMTAAFSQLNSPRKLIAEWIGLKLQTVFQSPSSPYGTNQSYESPLSCPCHASTL